MIDRLSDHVIICGFGQMGRNVATNLTSEGIPFVVVDVNAEAFAAAEKAHQYALEGDAADEQALRRAGIDRARALIAAVDTDAQSVFIVLTARSLRPDLRIIARAEREDTEPKLQRAGADRVILPYRLGGQRMVSLVSRPGVSDFLDEVMHSGELELALEEVVVDESSRVAGHTLASLQVRQEYGVTVLAIVAPDRPVKTTPQGFDHLDAGARVIALGTYEALESFARVLGPV
jgi:voltage-gated potassium channel